MKAEELRIGNYVMHGADMGIVSSLSSEGHVDIDILGTNKTRLGDIENTDPIPITVDVLLKCGFGRDKNENYYLIYPTGAALHSIYLMYEIAGKDIVGYMWFGKRDDNTRSVYLKAEHLHQLQNIYFAITGEELEVKL